MTNGWKIATIVLIVVLVVETLFIVWVFNVGTEIIENEDECSINICAGDAYDAYYYDNYDKMCYCYKDHEIVYQEYVK